MLIHPLHLCNFSQSSNRRSCSSGSWGTRLGQLSEFCPVDNHPSLDLRNCPCATSNCLSTTLAVPDPNGVSLHAVLSAECADVSGVLGDFHLLDLFSEGGTITSTVFTGHTDLCAAVSPDTCCRAEANSLFVRFVMLASLNEEYCGNCGCWCCSTVQLDRTLSGSNRFKKVRSWQSIECLLGLHLDRSHVNRQLRKTVRLSCGGLRWRLGLVG